MTLVLRDFVCSSLRASLQDIFHVYYVNKQISYLEVVEKKNMQLWIQFLKVVSIGECIVKDTKKQKQNTWDN